MIDTQARPGGPDARALEDADRCHIISVKSMFDGRS
jgi:hypothetical protein